MKKQMMTLALCLALTATSALANGAKTTSKTQTKALTPVATKTVDKTNCKTTKQNFEEKMAKDRADLYCKLGLSNDQKTKAETIHQKNMKDAEPLFKKLSSEKAKLHELKANNACAIKIDEQKLKVKEAKHALKAHMKASRKEFEALLDKCQLAKFKALKEERKAQWEKCKCHHHHNGACKHDDDSYQGPGANQDEQAAPEKCPCKSK